MQAALIKQRQNPISRLLRSSSRSIIVISGAKNRDHILDNFAIFDFELTSEDMAKIAEVDKNVRYYTATPEIIASYAAMELKEDL